MHKMKLDHQFTPYTRVNSKGMKDLNLSHDTIKILEKIIGSKILAILHSDIFTDTSPKTRETKDK